MAQIVFPFTNFTDGQFAVFESHYADWIGVSRTHTHALRDIATEYCYGGLPLESLYSTIALERSMNDPLSATILLTPARGSGIPPLTIRDVSLRQFLAAGLPKKDWYENGWIRTDGLWVPGGGYWDQFNDAQYRLELAHAETCTESGFDRELVPLSRRCSENRSAWGLGCVERNTERGLPLGPGARRAWALWVWEPGSIREVIG